MTGIMLSALLMVPAGEMTPPPMTANAVVVADAPSTGVTREAARLKLPTELPPVDARSSWRSESAPPAQSHGRRTSLATKIVGAALGAVGGFYAGGAIGYALTQDRSNPNDDGVSGLRGVVIGAPIGAAVGGLIGLTLTK